MTNLDFEGLTDAQKRLFAVRSVRRVQHLMKDPRSVAVLDVAERHARGEATDDELEAARAAAWEAAAASTAEAAVSAAARAAAAAWAAASTAEAAWAAAALNAAWAAARAAAAWAAAEAAQAERETQREILEQIRKEGRE